MIALGMNSEPLPSITATRPAYIIPGLYGYVSATKWLSEIELTTWEAFDGCSIRVGLGEGGAHPDRVPHRRAFVAAPPSRPARSVAIAGVAWAPDRGVRGRDRHQQRRLAAATVSAAPLNNATSVVEAAVGRDGQSIAHHPRPGHEMAGEVQTEEVTDPAPDGARGHHSIQFTVA